MGINLVSDMSELLACLFVMGCSRFILPIVAVKILGNVRPSTCAGNQWSPWLLKSYREKVLELIVKTINTSLSL